MAAVCHCNYLFDTVDLLFICKPHDGNYNYELLGSTTWQQIYTNEFQCSYNKLSFWIALLILLISYKRYEPEGCRFDSRWGHSDFSLT